MQDNFSLLAELQKKVAVNPLKGRDEGVFLFFSNASILPCRSLFSLSNLMVKFIFCFFNAF